MRNSFVVSVLLVNGAAVLCAAQDNAQPPGIESFTDPSMTKRLVDYWADSQCFKYSDNSEPNIKEQCKEACFPGGVTSDVPAGQFVQSSQTCWYNGIESNSRTGKPLTEDEKNQSPRTVKSITTGYCTCDDPIVSIVGDFFIKSVAEAGKILKKIMCPTLLALDLVVEIGSAAIPGVGKAITVGMSIKTAKMYQHAYDAQEAAMEWASMFVDQGFGLASEAGCKKPFAFSKVDLAKRFSDFANAPDQLVPGINYDELPCPKGKKASKKCKERNGEADDGNTPSKTENANQPSQTGVKSSQTSTNAQPTKNPDCAAIGRSDFQAMSDEEPSDDLISKRVARTSLQDRRLHIRSFAPKEATVCKTSSKRTSGVEFNSKNYPSAGEEFMKGKLAFGFDIMHDCSDYSWGVQQTWDSSNYDTEHVLEWSIVKNFVDVMNKHPDFAGGFNHPDPENNEMEKGSNPPTKKKVNFCTYWRESWAWPRSGKRDVPLQKMPDPAVQTPVSGADQVMQFPLDWLAEAYPFVQSKKTDSRRAYEGEFLVLQKTVNSHPKNRMFSPVPGTAIFNDEDMEKLIKRKNTQKKGGALKYPEPSEQPRAAVQRIRSVVGAYLYLKDDRVNKIFIDQVDRIGNQLELLEIALSKNPRVAHRGAQGSKDPPRIVVYNSWTPLKLKEKWFTYMDEVYETANNKGAKFIKDNVKRLKDEYTDAKKISQVQVDKEKDKDKKSELAAEKKLRDDMPDHISKLEAAWARAQNWPKPKWNAVVTPTPGSP